MVARVSPKKKLGPTISLGRRAAIIETARAAGLLSGENGRIAARIRQPLIEAAKANSGIQSDSELLEYALACVALEDDFAAKLLAREGSVDKSLDLEF
ncbi:MAG TPA: hypothetical protein VK446_02575 [Methylocystis sp.]|nr:hypothetical protein [Methylocystis sp.]